MHIRNRTHSMKTIDWRRRALRYVSQTKQSNWVSISMANEFGVRSSIYRFVMQLPCSSYFALTVHRKLQRINRLGDLLSFIIISIWRNPKFVIKKTGRAFAKGDCTIIVKWSQRAPFIGATPNVKYKAHTRLCYIVYYIYSVCRMANVDAERFGSLYI